MRLNRELPRHLHIALVCQYLVDAVVDGYTRPFHENYGDSVAGSAGDMLDLIEEGAFVAT